MKALESRSLPPDCNDTKWWCMNLQILVQLKLLSTWKMFWAHEVPGGTHSSVTHVTFCFIVTFLWIRFYFEFFYHYINSKMLLGKPNGNTICCTCALGVFTTQRSLLTFIISVQRKNTDGKINLLFLSLSNPKHTNTSSVQPRSRRRREAWSTRLL